MKSEFETLKLNFTNPPVLAFPDFQRMFSVETDASDTEVEEILLQKHEDGKPHHIQHTRRTMNEAKKKSFSFDRENPAVIFALMKSRIHMLFLKHLELINNHQAVQCGFKKHHVHDRLPKWMDIFAEYDFLIMYKPNTSNKTTAFLLRFKHYNNIDAVEEGELLFDYDLWKIELQQFIEEVKRLCSNCTLRSIDKELLLSARCGDMNFIVWDGKLFCKTELGARVVVSVDRRRAIF